jgi:cysteine desulfurase
MSSKGRTYLDYASGVSGNPSSPHHEGRKAKKMLEDARSDIARLVEVKSDDVVFTSGATEANALAILGAVRGRQQIENSKKIHAFYLPSAHASIVENAKSLAREGVLVEALPVRDFRVDTEALESMLRDDTALITMEAVCGETGVVWNTREVAEVLKKFRTGAQKKESARFERPIRQSFFSAPVLHVDASQAPLTQKLTRAHFAADMLTLDGSKVGDVRGIGVFIAHRTIPIVPLYKGGGQERALRPGSEAPELAQRFAASLGAAAFRRDAFRISALEIRKHLIATILEKIPSVLMNEGRAQAPNILNISLPGRDTDYLVALLDEAGFALSTRSACETDSLEGSRAVFALTRDRERALSTLRISWGPDAKSSEITKFVRELAQAVAFIDSQRLG